MGVENLVVLVALSLLLLPLILAIGIIAFINTCKWSVNFRHGYVQLLLKIFQVM